MKKNRSLFSILTMIIMLGLSTSNAWAEEEQNSLNKESAVAEATTEEIMSYVHDYDSMYEWASELDAEDISWENSVKVYIETDVWTEDNMTNDKLQTIVGESEYVWVVPIYSENETMLATLAIGKPITNEAKAILSEEEIQELETHVGKWTVSSLSVYEEHIDYQAAVADALQSLAVSDTETEIYYVSGSTGYRAMTALAVDAQDIYVIPLNPGDDTSSSGTAAVEYEDFKEDLEFDSTDSELTTGYAADASDIEKNQHWAVIGIALLIFLGCVICFLIKRKKKIAPSYRSDI